MKFYLTKKAQLEAEGRGAKPKAAKPQKAPKSPRAENVAAAPAPQATAVAPTAAPLSSLPAPVAESALPQTTAPTALRGGRAAKAPKNAEKGAKKPKPSPQPKGVASIGGVPRVDLLPLEVRAERRANRNVRRVWLGVVGVAVLAGIATGGATIVAMRAQSDLVASQAETSSLSAEQAKYSKVKVVENKADLIDAAREVGGATDIDWNSYLSKLQATLPTGTTIKSVNVDSASAIAAYTQSSAALQGVRIGTVSVTVTSPTLPSVPVLLNGLVTLPGYVDAVPGSVTSDGGVFTANIVMHINQDAYSGLYSKKGK